MSDYAACAELCERNGFEKPAEVLRAIDQGRGRVFLVRPGRFLETVEESRDMFEYLAREGRPEPDAVYLPAEPPAPPTGFVSREDAERFARSHSARALRGVVVGYLRWFSDMETGEFVRRVIAAQVPGYQAPNDPSAPLFPGWATDEQLVAIARSIDLTVYDVLPVEIAP